MRARSWILSCVLCFAAWGCSDFKAGCTFDDSQCRRIAVQAVSSWGWGEPVRMTYEGNWYEFRFETPEWEIPLLGERTVRVHCGTGSATVPLRQ